MGTKVNASQAAQLVNRTERRVRQWITDGKLRAEPSGPRTKVKQSADPKAPKVKPVGPTAWAIDVDDLALVPGVAVDASRLAELVAAQNRTPTGMLARIEQLEREIRGLKSRLSLLEGRRDLAAMPANASGGQTNSLTAADPSPYMSLAALTSSAMPAPRREAYVASATGAFRTRSDAARWLVEHGVNSEHSPKSWPGWQSIELDRAAVLRVAMARWDPSDWRISWKLHQCSDPLCVCRDLLTD